MAKSAYARLASVADELAPSIALIFRQQTTRRQRCGSPGNAAKNGARSETRATGVARRKYVSYHFTTGIEPWYFVSIAIENRCISVDTQSCIGERYSTAYRKRLKRRCLQRIGPIRLVNC